MFVVVEKSSNKILGQFNRYWEAEGFAQRKSWVNFGNFDWKRSLTIEKA